VVVGVVVEAEDNGLLSDGGVTAEAEEKET